MNDTSYDSLLDVVKGTFPADQKIEAVRNLALIDLNEEQIRDALQATFGQRPPVLVALLDALRRLDSGWAYLGSELLLIHDAAEVAQAAHEAISDLSDSTAACEAKALASGEIQQPSDPETVVALLAIPLEKQKSALERALSSETARSTTEQWLLSLDEFLLEHSRRGSSRLKVGSFLHQVRQRIYELVFVSDHGFPEELTRRAADSVFKGDPARLSELARLAPRKRAEQMLMRSLENDQEDNLDRLHVTLTACATTLPPTEEAVRHIRFMATDGPAQIAAESARALLRSKYSSPGDFDTIAKRTANLLDAGRGEIAERLAQELIAATAGLERFELSRVPDTAQSLVVEQLAALQGAEIATRRLVEFVESRQNLVQYRRKVQWAFSAIDELLDAEDVRPETGDAQPGAELPRSLYRVIEDASRYAASESNREAERVRRSVDLVNGVFALSVARATARPHLSALLEQAHQFVGESMLDQLLGAEDTDPAATLGQLALALSSDEWRFLWRPLVNLCGRTPQAIPSALEFAESQGLYDFAIESLAHIASEMRHTEMRLEELEVQRAEGARHYASQVTQTLVPLLRQATQYAEGNEDLIARYGMVHQRLLEEGLLVESKQNSVPDLVYDFAQRYVRLPSDKIEVIRFDPPTLSVLGEGALPGQLIAESLQAFIQFGFTSGVKGTKDRQWIQSLFAAVLARALPADLLQILEERLDIRTLHSPAGQALEKIWRCVVAQEEPDKLADFVCARSSSAPEQLYYWLVIHLLKVRPDLLRKSELDFLRELAVPIAENASTELASLLAEAVRTQEEVERLRTDVWGRVASQIGPTLAHLDRVMYGYFVLRRGLESNGWKTVEPELGRMIPSSEVDHSRHQLASSRPHPSYVVRSTGVAVGETVVEKAYLEGVDEEEGRHVRGH